MTESPKSRSFHNSALPSDFTSSIGTKMIKVTAGTFMMGSPNGEQGHCAWEQQREITLMHDFFLGEVPVTQGQFAEVMGKNPTQFKDHNQNAPADTVQWDEAMEFCRKLSERDRGVGVLPQDWEYRLPTEAEWEYGGRAGNTNARYGELEKIAWYFANSNDSTHPVRQKQPNNWGFYDMLGNVWEYCLDWYHQGHRQHAVRGGSFFNSPACCRFAARERWGRARYVGFRLFAGPTGISCTPADATFPVDNIKTSRSIDIYDAIDGESPELAEKMLSQNPESIESIDEIPPPIFHAIWSNKPKMLEWLLDHGADIERRNQDYGTTPLVSAVIACNKDAIAILVARGANQAGAMQTALTGLAGGYENSGIGRDGFTEILTLLQSLGVN